MSSKDDDGSNNQMTDDSLKEEINASRGGEVGNAIAKFGDLNNSRPLLPRLNHTDQCEG